MTALSPGWLNFPARHARHSTRRLSGELQSPGPSVANDDLGADLLHQRHGLDFHFTR
jgi:hypothetical protein